MPTLTDFLYYSPNWNYIGVTIGESGSIILVYLLYIILCVAVLIIVGRYSAFNRTAAVSRRKIMRNVALGILGTMVLLQVVCQQSFLIKLIKRFSNQTIGQKYKYLFGPTYSYVRFVLNHAHERCAGKLITDLNINGTLEPYILKYFLYPDVDVLSETSDPTCLIIFRKANPEQSVPDNFEIVGKFDAQSLIALRKKTGI